jgi:hypothetical protein
MVLSLWGTLSDGRTGLSCVYAAGPSQCSLSQVRVPRDSWPYFTVSDLRLPFLSPPMTRMVMVEVFDPAYTRVYWPTQSYVTTNGQSASLSWCQAPIKVKITLRLMVSQSKSKLCYDRRSVGQSVLVSSTHLGLTTRFLLLRHLRVCWCGVLPLMRERVCHLQFLLFLASAVILGSESRGTHDHILLFQIRDSPKLEVQVSVFISPRTRLAQLYPQALGSLSVASCDSQGYGGGIQTRLHAGFNQSVKSSELI